jgi:hypothetical protein
MPCDNGCPIPWCQRKAQGANERLHHPNTVQLEHWGIHPTERTTRSAARATTSADIIGSRESVGPCFSRAGRTEPHVYNAAT